MSLGLRLIKRCVGPVMLLSEGMWGLGLKGTVGESCSCVHLLQKKKGGGLNPTARISVFKLQESLFLIS